MGSYPGIVCACSSPATSDYTQVVESACLKSGLCTNRLFISSRIILLSIYSFMLSVASQLASAWMDRRLSVTNFRSENNLRTFWPNFPVALMTTGAFSQNVGKLFSELKLVTDNLFIQLHALFTTKPHASYYINSLHTACCGIFKCHNTLAVVGLGELFFFQ